MDPKIMGPSFRQYRFIKNAIFNSEEIAVFNPRPGQLEVSEYEHGKMGITAVPGSGKTHTLSFLASKLIASDLLNEDQEILVVTLVNSAVNNFTAKISGFLKAYGLIPGIGYRVRTLHGLAYDIVREQPHLAGLDNQFSIADERASNDILTLTATNWMRLNNDILTNYSLDKILPSDIKKYWGQLIQTIASSYIKLAKDFQLAPTDSQILIDNSNVSCDLLKMGNHIYTEYQQSLQDRGSVDFDDLIRLAHDVLINNPDYLSRLQLRWPIILEDEAQDSSHIQEKMLNLLTSSQKNWVRVGDPNQAIFETFTTADPELLRAFVRKANVRAVSLPHSGRSTKSIINLANFLILWTKNEHPVNQLRHALDEPLINPTPKDDPQPNPEDKPDHIIFFNRALKPREEIEKVARSARKWVRNNPSRTAAILVPRNNRGSEIVEQLTRLNIPCVELLSTSKATRDAASILGDILRFFASPNIRRNLINAFNSIASVLYDIDENKEGLSHIRQQLNKVTNPENIFTQPDGVSYLSNLSDFNENEKNIIHAVFLRFIGWQRSILLPIDEMIITIGSEIFHNPSDLALSHKIAMVLKRSLDYYPEWQLPDFCKELEAITKNRYRMYGFSEEDIGFDPDIHKGKIVVSTMHKAKGLEWDRVYLMSINNYNFPSASEIDSYYSEKWFVVDQRNLEAETLERLSSLANGVAIDDQLLIHDATQKARFDYCAERLRLLYVGITRAKEELIFTWNTGRNNDCVEALPLQKLREYWENNLSGH
jgi:DNA helicase-2/ATP-dependent DNA helicase PcrA